MTRPRVLLAITVYNGRSFVPRCLDSAAVVQARSKCHVDAVVFDDASPEPGFSEACEGWAAERGIGYYRTPRNLGIPRNFNLTMLCAEAGGYDHVLISNSDVIYSANAIDEMVAVADTDVTIGSVTAWSTNVSIFSLPNTDPDLHLGDQGSVDQVGEALAAGLSGQAIDLPTGVGFALLVPRAHIRDVGLMDPVFGRGYCEEVDWCRRSIGRGLRAVLAPGAFIYHEGGVSNTEAGLLNKGDTTVMANEAIIDLRHPTYRDELIAFQESGAIDAIVAEGLRQVTVESARRSGYVLEVGWFQSHLAVPGEAHCLIDPSGDHPKLHVSVSGFTHHEVLPTGGDPVARVVELLGREPRIVRLSEDGRLADLVAASPLVEGAELAYCYPGRVFRDRELTHLATSPQRPTAARLL